jgi:hypothetical protein
MHGQYQGNGQKFIEMGSAGMGNDQGLHGSALFTQIQGAGAIFSLRSKYFSQRRQSNGRSTQLVPQSTLHWSKHQRR